MFGKPQWFCKKTVGWGLRPVDWRGWVYAMVWAAVICVPFVSLLVQSKVIESLIWVVAMMAAMLWDVRSVMRDIDAPAEQVAEVAEVIEAEEAEVDAGEDDVLIIDEDTEPDPRYFATRSYDLHLGR